MDDLNSEERLNRMRAMFASDGEILADDYEHFTRQQGASTRQSKEPRKSEKQTAQQDPKRS